MRRLLFPILFTGACLIGVYSAPIRAQALSNRSGAPRTFVDSKGNKINSNSANLPFKLINGFPEYIVGPGDILEITTFETGERTTEIARVIPDGTVSFSVVDDIPVAGLALSEVENTLSRALSRYVRNSKTQVLIKQYLSKSVSVFGSINTTSTLTGSLTGPGIYALKGRISTLEQILQAGGPTPDARLDRVRLIRANRSYTINLQRAVTTGDNSQNILLEHGDLLQVTGISQADRRIVVLGEVSTPGVFNLSSEANMLEAIAATGGFTQNASANRIRVIRRSDPINPEILTVNAERIFQGDMSQNVGLEDGDILVVPRDRLTDLNDLLTSLAPILSWGGLVVTQPVLRVGGYDVNSPSTAVTIPSSVEGTTGGGLLGEAPVQSLTVQQQLIEQIQRNLRNQETPRQKASESENKK